MSMEKIKKDDTVKVIAGKDVGAEGKVLSVDKKSGRLIVEGVNIVKKHTKPSMANQNGGIIEQEAPIDASNVMVVCPVCNKATRVAYAIEGEKKARICKKCGATLDATKEAKEVKKATKKKTKKAAEKPAEEN